MIYILIPTYNESLNINTLAANLKNCMTEEDKSFVFVDDCSTDDTIEVIKKEFDGTTYTILDKPKNQGPGHSFNIGFKWIIEQSNEDKDIVVTLEADNTSDLTILPNMITISRMGFDLVLASIYAQGGSFFKTSFFRKFISFFANMIFRAIFNIKVLTLSSFYRVYQVGLLKEIQCRWTDLVEEKGFICMLEILIKAIKSDASIIEVPMVLKSDKRIGKSKMKIFKTSISYIRFLFFKKI